MSTSETRFERPAHASDEADPADGPDGADATATGAREAQRAVATRQAPIRGYREPVARTPAAVSMRGVSKRFGPGVPVLDGVDLEVGAGEFVCLVGASGSGKSTLLALAAGLETPTSGSVEVSGGRAALVFQEHALFPWLTAGRNVELALRLRGVPRAERAAQARRLLDVVRLGHAAGRRVHELSGGMRQRVAIARALAQDASVLLMDEPFGALDAITRDELHEELVGVWAETGVAVVFVTHNVREAVRLGQRVLLLGAHPGRVVREWPVEVGQPRRIESPAVSALAVEITQALHEEMRRAGA